MHGSLSLYYSSFQPLPTNPSYSILYLAYFTQSCDCGTGITPCGMSESTMCCVEVSFSELVNETHSPCISLN